MNSYLIARLWAELHRLQVHLAHDLVAPTVQVGAWTKARIGQPWPRKLALLGLGLSLMTTNWFPGRKASRIPTPRYLLFLKNTKGALLVLKYRLPSTWLNPSPCTNSITRRVWVDAVSSCISSSEPWSIPDDVTATLTCRCAQTIAYAHHNHADSDDTEREYDRLRDLARSEASKRNSCFERVWMASCLVSDAPPLP